MWRRSGDGGLAKAAYVAWDAEDWSRAGELLEEAVRRDPDGRESEKLWFDAALAYKFLRNWQKAYDLGLEAAARATRGEQDPAFWNLGIAATVLRDWRAARDAWTGYGITLGPGDGEIVENFGMTCVRITTASGSEVIWARRICPTRALILSVPFDPGRRFGEVVLHDGTPNGDRVSDGRRYPVFDEIALFAPSDLATLSVFVTAPAAEHVEALMAAFEEQDFGVEALSGAQVLCKCCSEGPVTVERRVQAGRQTMLLGAPEQRARELLDEWRAADPTFRDWENLHPAV